jgi:hypothetical protein
MPLVAFGVFTYFATGLILAFCDPNDSNLRGRFVCSLIWPWVLWADGTPRIRWLTHFSGVEVVIEETTTLDMRVIQTVRQASGYEYTRIKE